MQKNVSGQKIGAQMIDATTGAAFTSAVTVAVTIDAGTQATGTVGSGACTHEGNGYHTYAPSQAETNGALLAFTFIGTGAVPATVQVFTTGFDPTAAQLPANVTQWNGTNVASPHTAGYPVVTIKDGTGTGELDTASGAVAAVASVVAVASGAITSGSFATGAITAAALATDAVDEIVDGVWNEATSGHTTPGTTGKALIDAGAAGTPPTAEEIADMVATRGSSNWEGDVEIGSIGQAALEATHNTDTTTNVGYVTVFAADGTTPLFKRLLATDPAADPLTGIAQRQSA